MCFEPNHWEAQKGRRREIGAQTKEGFPLLGDMKLKKKTGRHVLQCSTFFKTCSTLDLKKVDHLLKGFSYVPVKLHF